MRDKIARTRNAVAGCQNRTPLSRARLQNFPSAPHLSYTLITCAATGTYVWLAPVYSLYLGGFGSNKLVSRSHILLHLLKVVDFLYFIEYIKLQD